MYSHGILTKIGGHSIYTCLYMGQWLEYIVGIYGHIVFVQEIATTGYPYLAVVSSEILFYLFNFLYIYKHAVTMRLQPMARHTAIGLSRTAPIERLFSRALYQSHALYIYWLKKLIETTGQTRIAKPVDIYITVILFGQTYAGWYYFHAVAQSAKGDKDYTRFFLFIHFIRGNGINLETATRHVERNRCNGRGRCVCIRALH